MMKHLGKFSVLAIVLCLPQTASAYRLNGDSWPASQRPVPYYINSNGAPSGFTSAVQRGAKSWSDHSGFDFQFRYLGATARSGVNARDGQHVVSYNRTGRGLPPTTLAVTTNWSNGRITGHFDMVFNGVARWSSNPANWQHDIESVAVHEFGHALGLGHSSGYGTVMYPTIAPGVRLRNLTRDDIAGAARLYPNSSNPSTPSTPYTPSSPTNRTKLRLHTPQRQWISTSMPSFLWDASSQAVAYELRVDQDHGHSRIIHYRVRSNLFQSNRPLARGWIYTWWVRAIYSDGSYGPWSGSKFGVR